MSSFIHIQSIAELPIPTSFSLFWNGSSVIMTWGVDPLLSTEIYRDGTFYLLMSVGVTNYFDSAVISGNIYQYKLRSTNGILYSQFTTEYSILIP